MWLRRAEPDQRSRVGHRSRLLSLFSVSLASRFALLILMVWIVPILLAVFLAVVFEFEELVLYIGSVSPLTLITLAAQGLLSADLFDDDLALLRNAYWIGSTFILTLTLFLGYRMKLMKDSVRSRLYK